MSSIEWNKLRNELYASENATQRETLEKYHHFLRTLHTSGDAVCADDHPQGALGVLVFQKCKASYTTHENVPIDKVSFGYVDLVWITGYEKVDPDKPAFMGPWPLDNYLTGPHTISVTGINISAGGANRRMVNVKSLSYRAYHLDNPLRTGILNVFNYAAEVIYFKDHRFLDMVEHLLKRYNLCDRNSS